MLYHSNFPKHERLRSLDVLRGVGTFIVFSTHFGLIELNGVGVDLFFVLSGFLVSKSLLNSDKKNFVKIFLIKRMTRILPAYYLFLVLGYITAYILLIDISPQNIPLLTEWKQYFFFYRNYGGPPARWTFEHLWSLCVEEHFYFTLLFCFMWLRHRKKFYTLYKRLVIFAIVLGILIKVQALITDFAEWPTYTHNRIDSFAWGMLIYILQCSKPNIFDRKWLYLLGLLLLFITIVLDKTSHHLILRTIAPFAWTLFIVGIYHHPLKFLAFFRVIAKYSYSIYLWHFLFIIPIHHYFGATLIGLAVYTSITVFFAILSKHTAETFGKYLQNYLLAKVCMI